MIGAITREMRSRTSAGRIGLTIPAGPFLSLVAKYKFIADRALRVDR